MKSDDEFINFYKRLVLTKSNPIFNNLNIDLGDEHYRLFCHLTKYSKDEYNKYIDLLSIILTHKQEFVKQAKEKLIRRLSEYYKIYIISFTLHTDDDIVYKVVVRETSQNSYKQESYDIENDNIVSVDTAFIQADILIAPSELNDSIKSTSVSYKYSKGNDSFYDLEFKNAGMFNMGLEMLNIVYYS